MTPQFHLFFFLDYFQQRPEYSVDLNNSVYTSQYYDTTTNEYVFVVEQGRQFFLKLNLSANPPPSNANVNLYENGQKLQSGPGGTINLQTDSVGIRTTTKSHEGSYTIESSTIAGEGSLRFRIQVQGIITVLYNQRAMIIIFAAIITNSHECL